MDHSTVPQTVRGKRSVYMKKSLCTCALLLALACQVTADNLADLLQDLAIQTACLGRYSAAETGKKVVSRHDDPRDWYDPPYMANRFAAMSGEMTRITTFYGVCFDYAEFAWDDIQKYQTTYNEAGMKDQEWYIAGADWGDPHTIILYDPVPEELATTKVNGVFVKEHARHNVTTHDLAEGHAWLWVQHKNGTWYWIDPTWTDNTGFPWWGMVENGKEVQYYPNSRYCVAANFPKPGVTNSETRSPDSTYTADPNVGKSLANFAYIFGYSTPFDFNMYKWGISFSVEDAYLRKPFTLFYNFSLDYFNNTQGGEKTWKKGNKYYISSKDDSLIFGTGIGVPLFSWFIVYAGGGLGFTWHSYPDSEASTEADLAWKVNGGLRFKVYDFFIKLDASYGTVIGPALGIGLGLAL